MGMLNLQVKKKFNISLLFLKTFYLIFIKQKFNIRGKQFRVFISGDYELLSKMFGISGAAGMRTLNLKFVCMY